MNPTPSPPGAPLAPELAFVVQLQDPPRQGSDQLAGRVEHIASGQVARFTSLTELHEFMGRASGRGAARPAS